MTHDEFDPDDLDALRKLKAPAQASSPESRPADGRRLRSPAGADPRNVQLNVRVRRAIKQMAYEVARRRRCSMADVIETAVEELYQRGAGSDLASRPPANGESR